MQHASTGSIMAVAVLLAALTGCSKQTAEEKGAALATEKIDLVKGVGSALEEKGAQAAESLTSGLGKVVQGVEKGIASITVDGTSISGNVIPVYPEGTTHAVEVVMG